MSLTDIKTKNQGFTIVELLIVVVVIAILAAITIVSYAGITARANESAVKLQASNFLKKVEAYNAEKGAYPTAVTDLSTSSSTSYYWADTTNVNGGTTKSAVTTNLDNTGNVTKKLGVKFCTTGVRAYFYNPNKSGGAGVDSSVTGTCADS